MTYFIKNNESLHVFNYKILWSSSVLRQKIFWFEMKSSGLEKKSYGFACRPGRQVCRGFLFIEIDFFKSCYTKQLEKNVLEKRDFDQTCLPGRHAKP